MALPKLLKHIYHNATDEVIRRGKRIFHTGGAHLVENDPITETVTFRVRNDVYYNQYRVKIENYGSDKKQIRTRCQCPYNMGIVCKHEAAALFQLNDLIQSGFFDNIELTFDQKDTTVRMHQITKHFLKLFSSSDIYHKATILQETKGAVKIKKADKDTVHSEVKDKSGVNTVIIRQNEERYFDTSCSCDESKHPLCVHKVAVFLRLYEEKGSHFFSTIRDWDAQKNKLLSLYGYSLKDDLTNKFEFAFHEGKLFMRVLNPSIKKIALQPQTGEFKTSDKKEEKLEYGVVLEKKGKVFPFTTFQLISGSANESKTQIIHKIKRCEVNSYISPSAIDSQERELITILRKLDPEKELSKYLQRHSPFGDFLDNLTKKLKTANPKENLRTLTWDFYLPKYQNLLQQFQDFPYIYYLPENQSFSKKNLEPITFSSETFRLSLEVIKDNHNDDINVKRSLTVGEKVLDEKDTEIINSGLIKSGNQIFAAQSAETIKLMEEFESGEQKAIKAQDWPEYLEKVLLPLKEPAFITFDEALKTSLPSTEPELRLYLMETEKLMVFKPVFAYGDVERDWQDNRKVTWAENGLLKVQNRDLAEEQTFLNLLRYLHPEMQEHRKTASFQLPTDKALKGDWYFRFLEQMESKGVKIFGYDKLRKLRINPHRPKTRVHIVAGINWFDTELELSFGEEKVDTADLKKALSKKQNYVSLKDGTLGLLTEEWMAKYALMIKMGSLNGSQTLRIKKIHFSILENLEEEVEEEDIRRELAERSAKILAYDYDSRESIPIPQNVTADLRPYQKAGFQWMNFLEETSWGGILADDMGLGKTLQSLAYLQYYLNQNPDALFLIVCPTTLIYNWESEILKFTPDISYSIHHGSGRTSSAETLRSYGNLLITTYGTLRSDIKMLSGMQFDYVVLDESQAIKNPKSQVARASLLLNSKNRLALSGTPVQNNTFDLFAQINFLNPGMLGSMEFFRSEFAVPIDKMQEKEARDNLKKLIHPFLLRRTKEQVAPDLPTKTETTIFCEMGQQQKQIYNTYKNSFRSKILGEIDEKGINRSRLSVLTGLMKLRQICDSPAILKEGTKSDNHSVKINELIRELTENTGQHKALVFSQFLGMLALIRTELDRLNIPYVYFDGRSASKDREKAIKKFQSDDECRVFLISLKAGGVGLNLTAADYVYIVDPWWNPTVEQQAIDRTHRIGQTKKIFAYRLICKNTIEEKILLLQRRKLNLAKDLIADENSFVKKLTRDDIAYLLS